jgi:HTH-type transcriptional regulator, transcriptional repressor of NAD biosynthesis genes
VKHALIIGKFYPPHAGHHYLIATAVAECDNVIVLLLWSETEGIPWDLRLKWLQERHPSVTVKAAQDEVRTDYNNSDVWREHVLVMKRALRGSSVVTHVYGSEHYIAELARWFGATPRVVDLSRSKVPVSGTAVRGNLRGNWQFLEAPVRSWIALQRRIVLIGAESAGTTTLTRDLADHYRTCWVPEYGRTYTNGLPINEAYKWTHEDFTHIIDVQQEMERQYATKTTLPFLLCDTDAFATCIWEKYLTERGDLAGSFLRVEKPYLYILTDLVNWEDDGTRFGEGEFRETMQIDFIDLLGPFTLRNRMRVNGTREQRLWQAVERIDGILKEPFDWPLPLGEDV